MQSAARIGIKLAREKNLYIVIDADGLYLLQDDPEIIKGYTRAVLTPNVVEFERLCKKMVSYLLLSTNSRSFWGQNRRIGADDLFPCIEYQN